MYLSLILVIQTAFYQLNFEIVNYTKDDGLFHPPDRQLLKKVNSG